MLEYIKKNFLIPGKVENWIILMDLDKLSLNEIPFVVSLSFDILIGTRKVSGKPLKLI